MYLLEQHTQCCKRGRQVFVSVVCLLVFIFSCPVALPQLPEGFWADERGIIYRGKPPEGQQKTNGTSDSLPPGFWADSRGVIYRGERPEGGLPEPQDSRGFLGQIAAGTVAGTFNVLGSVGAAMNFAGSTMEYFDDQLTGRNLQAQGRHIQDFWQDVAPKQPEDL